MFCQRWPQDLHKVDLTVKRKDIGAFLPNCWKTICSVYYTRTEAAFEPNMVVPFQKKIQSQRKVQMYIYMFTSPLSDLYYCRITRGIEKE